MKVYIVMRYWDNDEPYPEDFSHHEEPVKVFKSLEAATNYLNALTDNDILGSECEREYGWRIDKEDTSKVCVTPLDDRIVKEHKSIEEDESKDIVRSFHARNHRTYSATANIIFSILEKEVESERCTSKAYRYLQF